MTARNGNPEGRPRKPAALAILHGDASAKKRLAGAVPTGRVTKPKTLTPRASELWDEIAVDLIRLRIVGKTDVPALVELLEGMVLAQFYRGLMVRQLNGDAPPPGQTPAVYQYRTLMTVLNQGWAQFGLTPSSRTRVYELVNGGTAGGATSSGSDLLSG